MLPDWLRIICPILCTCGPWAAGNVRGLDTITDLQIVDGVASREWSLFDVGSGYPCESISWEVSLVGFKESKSFPPIVTCGRGPSLPLPSVCLVGVLPAHADHTIPGERCHGTYISRRGTVIDLAKAIIGKWDHHSAASAGNSIHPPNCSPVVWLVQEYWVHSGFISLRSPMVMAARLPGWQPRNRNAAFRRGYGPVPWIQLQPNCP